MWNRESFTDNGGLLRFSSFIANNFNGPQKSQKLQLRSKVKSSSAVGNRDKNLCTLFCFNLRSTSFRHIPTFIQSLLCTFHMISTANLKHLKMVNFFYFGQTIYEFHFHRVHSMYMYAFCVSSFFHQNNPFLHFLQMPCLMDRTLLEFSICSNTYIKH